MWSKISNILKERMETSKDSLLQISIKTGIDKFTLERYLRGDFSGPGIYIKHHLKKLEEYFQIKEDLLELYEQGLTEETALEEETHKKFRTNHRIGIRIFFYLLLFFAILILIYSYLMFSNILKTGLVTLTPLNERVIVDGKYYENTINLGIGEYLVEGPAILKTTDGSSKKILMKKYMVVVRWVK
ncbi:hypothetical protein JYK00_00955 [Thermosipho ferrireducens]|uniref:HTH cro/C1-type domain-containing protein n=1 Tax=Thermosipho ferrireducens TaxID=2571116 RepID=A0ABX7S7F7_9BACT|nr:hypothetical protein [Thermosipho ferrireducens]QTA38144.1 hypothetical protein JYK00_00955 [Thermosipho ferrireducens]